MNFAKSLLFELVVIGIDRAMCFYPVMLDSVLVKAESIPPDTPTIKLFSWIWHFINIISNPAYNIINFILVVHDRFV